MPKDIYRRKASIDRGLAGLVKDYQDFFLL